MYEGGMPTPRPKKKQTPKNRYPVYGVFNGTLGPTAKLWREQARNITFFASSTFTTTSRVMAELTYTSLLTGTFLLFLKVF